MHVSSYFYSVYGTIAFDGSWKMERIDGQFVQKEVIVIVLRFTVGIQENPLLF